MIVELGHYALLLALAVAVVQTVVPLAGAQRRDGAMMAAGTSAALVQAVLVALSFGALVHAYVTSDFSVANVAANSHSAKPMIYKISGVWGNHEGSMLLWVLILALFGGAVAAFGGNLPATLKARVLGIHGLLGIMFLAFVVFTSNPFLRDFPVPEDGRGLNPILQDPGLALHPPLLYLGYVGFSTAFAFAVAALLEGRIDAAWGRWVRPWTLAAWATLTLGIGLGSWWAYYELGWGGWWFWDPVENASLLPWLLGTALLHSAIVVEKREALKSWTILLAILTFGLSLLGTFLVRSGVLNSVHAFASDPDRGLFILLILVVSLGGALTLFAMRAPVLRAVGTFKPVSREGGMVINNLLMAVATFTVLLGTLYPMILDAVGGATVSVGPPFFNATFVPIMIPLILAMAVGPLLAWKRGHLAPALRRLIPAAVVAVIAAVAVPLIMGPGPWLAPVGIALAAWVGVAAVLEWLYRIDLFRRPGQAWRRAVNLPRASYGMTIAHFGVAVTVAGMVVSSAWQDEVITVMQPGDSAEVGGYTVTLAGLRDVQGPNYEAVEGRFVAVRGDQELVLTPSRRFYQASRMPTTEAAIRSSWLADFYVSLGDGDPVAGWTVRLYLNPLVPWIWGGTILMALGGLVSLSDRRLRVAAPARRSAAAGQTVRA